MTQALAADLPAGEHIVTYRVVSTDGHPVSGTVTFTSTAAPASASPSPTTTTPAALAERLVGGLAGAHGDHGTPSRRAPAATRPRGWSWPSSALLAALGLGAAWRTIGGREDRRRERTPRTTASTERPTRPDRFRPDAGRLLMSPSRAISSIGRAADS